MTSLQLVLTGKKTNFVTDLNPSLHFKEPCEIALINLETYYSIPNITEENNLIVVGIGDPDVEDRAFYIYLPVGSYNLKDINRVIQQQLRKLYKESPNIYSFYDDDDNDEVITLKPDINQLKTSMTIKKGYYVDFSRIEIRDTLIKRQINGILGFDSKIYKEGIHYSEHILEIMPVNSILVNLDIVTGSYVEGNKGNTVYTFFPSVSPGEKILERPPYPIYLPLLLNDIHSVRVTLTDQDGKLLDLRGESITIRFHIKNKTQKVKCIKDV